MPEYIIDNGLLNDIVNLQKRLAVLEQTARTGATQSPATEPSPSGGTGGISEAAADTRYVNVTGDTVTGALTLNSSLTATTATFSGNVTINGTLTTAGGGFAQDNLVVHLAGAETITGIKTFSAEQKFHITAYVDPDPGVSRAIKVGADGISVLGGIKTDTLNAQSGTFTGSGITTTAITVSAQITATGGINFGASAILDLSASNNMDLGTVGTGIGDKIALYTNTYGFGIQPNRLVAFVTSSGAFSVRPVNLAAGFQSAGTDAHTFLASGAATHTGALTVGTGLTVSAGTVSFPSRALSGSSLAFDSVTGVGASAGTGVGSLAQLTVGADNIAAGAVTNAKLSLAAVATNNVATGTLRDTSFSLFRTATAATTDEQGQAVGGLAFQVSFTRQTDAAAFDGVSISTVGNVKTISRIVHGIYYTKLKPGNYRMTAYIRSSDTATTSNVVSLQAASSTAGVITNNARAYYAGSDLSPGYFGIATTFTVASDMTSTNGLQPQIFLETTTVDISVSHVTVEPYDPLTPGAVTRQFIRALAVSDAQIESASVSKLISGTITADQIFMGSGHIYAGISASDASAWNTNEAWDSAAAWPPTLPRIEISSGGIFGFDSAGDTFSLTKTGLELRGTINSGSSITGATLVGLDGITAGVGNAVFRAGSQGIQLGDTNFNLAPFRVDMSGALNATNANISGTITGSTITGTNINATNTVSGAAVVANTISADKLSIAVVYSDERVTNPEFESGATGYTFGWDATGTTTANGIVAAGAPDGNIYDITVAANSGNSLASEVFPVRGNETYDVSTRVRAASAAGPIYLRVQFGTNTNFNVGSGLSGTVLWNNADNLSQSGSSSNASDIYSNKYFTALNVWVDYRGHVKAPPTATHMRVIVYAWMNPNAWTLSISNISAKQRSGGTEIANGVVNTDTVAATGISAKRISAGTLVGSNFIGVGNIGDDRNVFGAYIIIDNQASTRGIRFYNGSSTTVNMDLASGNVTITGTINAAGGTFSGSITSTATISGGTIQGTTVRSSGATNRVELTSSGLFAYDTAGTATVSILSSTGAATITGTVQAMMFRTALSGQRVEIDSSADPRNIRFYNSPGTLFASINGIVSGTDAVGLVVQGSGTTYGYMSVTPDRADLVYRTPTVNSFIRIGSAAIDVGASAGTLVNITTLRTTFFDGTSPYAILSLGNGLERVSKFSGGLSMTFGINAGETNSDLYALRYISTNPGGTGGFVYSSDQTLKRDIRDSTFDALTSLRTTPVRDYVWSETSIPDTGFIAQEVPELARVAITRDGVTTQGLSLDKMVAVLWKAIQMIDARIQDIPTPPQKTQP